MDGVASLGRVGFVPRYFEANAPRDSRGGETGAVAPDGVAAAALHLIQSALVLQPSSGSELDVRA